MYNMEIEGTHTYFVRAEGSEAEPVWVHNSCRVEAEAYEQRIREMYSGDQATAARQYRKTNGYDGSADAVTEIGDSRVAVDAKYVHDWSQSLRNPSSPIGNAHFAVKEQQAVVSQAVEYLDAFDSVIYHSNSPEFIAHYTNTFRQNGIDMSRVRFILTE